MEKSDLNPKEIILDTHRLGTGIQFFGFPTNENVDEQMFFTKLKISSGSFN
jgi:hypothetical protein